MRWRPSASSMTAPTSVGTPTAAIAPRTPAIVGGIGRGRRGRARPRPRRRGRGRSVTERSVGGDVQARDARGPRRPPTAPAALRTSTWIVATSTSRPVGGGERDRDRRRATRTAARPSGTSRAPPLPRRRATARPGAPFTATTTNVTPQTPGDGRERARSARLSTWLMPTLPHVNPPKRPEPAEPVEDASTGRPPERGRPADARAGGSRVRAAPNSAERDRHHDRERDPGELAEPPDPVDRGAVAAEAEHEAQERPAPRPGAIQEPQERRDRDEGERPQAGGRERERESEARREGDQERERGGEGRALRRSPGTASSSCPPAGCGASRGSSSCR